MLFLFQGRHRAIAQLLIGVALVAAGIVTHGKLALVVGGVLVAWSLCSAISGRQIGRSNGS